MREDPIEDVVLAAQRGDQVAWRELVRRFGRLVWVIARSYRLTEQDAEDVSQTTWLQLALHVRTLKDPSAVRGWLSTTARRESLRLAARRRELPADPLRPGLDRIDDDAVQGEDVVLRAELRERVREAFTRMSEPCQRLLTLLMADPPTPYAEISAKLGIPRGGIGPTRARCLDRLREVIGK